MQYAHRYAGPDLGEQAENEGRETAAGCRELRVTATLKLGNWRTFNTVFWPQKCPAEAGPGEHCPSATWGVVHQIETERSMSRSGLELRKTSCISSKLICEKTRGRVSYLEDAKTAAR